MDSLHVLVEQGKVLYLGISDTPAWVVSAMQTYAIKANKTPIAIYQGRWVRSPPSTARLIRLLPTLS